MLGITAQTSKENKIVQLFKWKFTDSWIALRVTVPFRQKELLAPGLFRLCLSSNVQCACLNNNNFLERQEKISRTVWCYSTHPPTSSQHDWKENGKRNAFERWPFLSRSQISSPKQFNVFIISKCLHSLLCQQQRWKISKKQILSIRLLDLFVLLRKFR